jgi:hypothetical protein
MQCLNGTLRNRGVVVYNVDHEIRFEEFRMGEDFL